MITVLILEDDESKLAGILKLIEKHHIPQKFVKCIQNAADAAEELQQNLYDLLILDINVPEREGDAPDPKGGEGLIKNIREKRFGIKPPEHIIGLTAFDNIQQKVKPTFEGLNWYLIKYDQTSGGWETNLSAMLEHIISRKEAESSQDASAFKCDVAIVTALESPELTAVRSLPLAWTEENDPQETTVYHCANLALSKKRNIQVVAASACMMGMPHATALASKMIYKWRPRYLFMAGICAGIESETELGDIIVADSCWDYGSGKFKQDEDGRQFFEQAPHQYALDARVRSLAHLASTNETFKTQIKNSYGGKVPANSLNINIGPLSSGAAVVASDRYRKDVEKQHRKLLGIEMEAYGVMCAGANFNLPRPTVIVAKSVCDFADTKKGDDFHGYAAHTSAAFCYNFIKEYLFVSGK